MNARSLPPQEGSQPNDLPSLAGDAAGQTLSVNALAKRIAQAGRQMRKPLKPDITWSGSVDSRAQPNIAQARLNMSS